MVHYWRVMMEVGDILPCCFGSRVHGVGYWTDSVRILHRKRVRISARKYSFDYIVESTIDNVVGIATLSTHFVGDKLRCFPGSIYRYNGPDERTRLLGELKKEFFSL